MSNIEVDVAPITALITAQQGKVAAFKSIITKFENLSAPFHGALQGAAGSKLQASLTELVETFRKSATAEEELLAADSKSVSTFAGQDAANSEALPTVIS